MYRHAASQAQVQQACIAAIMAITITCKLPAHVRSREFCSVIAVAPFYLVSMTQLAACANLGGLRAALQAHTQAITAGFILTRSVCSFSCASLNRIHVTCM